jgi:hypothetical protein
MRGEVRGHFEPTAASVREARYLAGPLLARLPPDVAMRIELVVSELATNAVRHAATPYGVTARVFPTPRVEVQDGSRRWPVAGGEHAVDPRSAASGGRWRPSTSAAPFEATRKPAGADIRT